MIDLHMHLNGSLSAKTIIKLAEKHNISLPTTNEEELKKLISVPLDCENLNDYLKCTKIPRLITQTKDGIADAVFCLLEELKEQGLIYAEIRFAPQRHRDNGLTQEEVIKSAIEGLKRSTLKAKLILCCMRGSNLYEENIETINLAKKYINNGVGGVDLAGAESLFKTSEYKDIFEYARKLNVPFTIHAGEADGAQSVRDAISFGAKRIGHGIHAIEDEELIRLILKNNITLELCPSSNLQTKASTIEDYPINKFFEKGVKLTINTDNKTISNTNLEQEYGFIEKQFNITKEQEFEFLNNSIDASFITEKEKRELKQIIIQKFKN